MIKTIPVLFCFLLLSGCSFSEYPSAVLSNLMAGVSQGGAADPIGLFSGALINGFFNIIGALPSP